MHKSVRSTHLKGNFMSNNTTADVAGIFSLDTNRLVGLAAKGSPDVTYLAGQDTPTSGIPLTVTLTSSGRIPKIMAGTSVMGASALDDFKKGSVAWTAKNMYGVVFEVAARAPQSKSITDDGIRVVSPVSVAGTSDWTGFTLPDLPAARFFPRSVSIEAYCADWTKVFQLVYYMGTSGYAKTAAATWNSAANGQAFGSAIAGRPGWRTFHKSLSDCSLGGAPDFAVDQMLSHKTRTYTIDGMASDITWGQIRFEDQDIASISICADDGTASWYSNAGPILDSLGLKASMAIIPDIVGTSTYVTWDQCRDWVARGHRIVTHGCRAGLANLTLYPTIEAAVADAVWSRKRIQEEGCDVDGSSNFYVWPQGAYNWGGSYANRELVDALLAAGFTDGRSTAGPQFFNSRHLATDAERMVMPIIGHTYISADEPGNIASIVSKIDAAAQYAYSATLVFHILNASPTVGTQISPANFTTLVNRLAYWVANGKLRVPHIHKQIGQI